MSSPSQSNKHEITCRDAVWESFVSIARECKCNVDFIINDALQCYLTERLYSDLVEQMTGSPVVSAFSSQSKPVSENISQPAANTVNTVQTSQSGMAQQVQPYYSQPAMEPFAQMQAQAEPVQPMEQSFQPPQQAMPVQPLNPPAAGFQAPQPSNSPAAGFQAPAVNPPAAFQTPQPSNSPAAFQQPASAPIQNQIPAQGRGVRLPPASSAAAAAGSRGLPPVPRSGFARAPQQPSAPAENFGNAQPPRPAPVPPPRPVPVPPRPVPQPPVPQPPAPQPPVPAAYPNPAPQPAAVSGPRLTLIFDNQRYPIDKDKFIIGRSSQLADLAIRDANISRKHCAVVLKNGNYYIKDLDSTNGIEYNGDRIDSKRIEEGDCFYVCEYEFRFTYK